ncbi:hypothetical protein FRC04_004142 [Tulasnella sp. 424]|nr:hypothetical protein FRC04_004142 [Tulasnella sp. 424]
MCDHQAQHILAVVLGNMTPLKPVQKGEEYTPCGFFGRAGMCSIRLEKPNRTVVPALECPQFYKLSITAAATLTASSPSTNRPISCLLCQAANPAKHGAELQHVHWSYNIAQHIAIAHPNKTVSEEFKRSYEVTQEEKERLGFKGGSEKSARSKSKSNAQNTASKKPIVNRKGDDNEQDGGRDRKKRK